MIFDGCTNDAAGISDEIGNHKDSAIVQELLGVLGCGDVRALQDELGVKAPHVVLIEYIGPRRWNPDVARNIDDLVAAGCTLLFIALWVALWRT